MGIRQRKKEEKELERRYREVLVDRRCTNPDCGGKDHPPRLLFQYTPSTRGTIVMRCRSCRKFLRLELDPGNLSVGLETNQPT